MIHNKALALVAGFWDAFLDSGILPFPENRFLT
jgi:hypothetical protein